MSDEITAANRVLVPGGTFSTGTGPSWQLHCPHCGPVEYGVDRNWDCESADGGEYSGDHDAVITHPDRDEYDSPMGTRGGWTEIKYYCGRGHAFRLLIGNHKGAEFLCVDYG